MVGTNTVVLPGSDAAVVRIKGTGKALAMTTDGNSRYCLLNPYMGGSLAVAEAARNVVCSGAKPLAVTDCLNFGNPERPDIMWQFILLSKRILLVLPNPLKTQPLTCWERMQKLQRSPQLHHKSKKKAFQLLQLYTCLC
jgi:hypothetical protein